MRLNEFLKVSRDNKVSIVDYKSWEELYFGYAISILKVYNPENYEVMDVMQRREDLRIIYVKEVK